MAILKKLKEVLDRAKIPYEVYNHRSAFTAQETAQCLHNSGKQMAKVVMLNADGCFLMAVVPANRTVNLKKVEAALDASRVSVAFEDEFAALFPSCEVGAMPPFGNLFGLPVYVDASLETQGDIFFNAGNHRQTVRLDYADFKKLANPIVVDWTEARYRKAA
jgi:Ala-tRNA(Pro) deacylase